jgi:hypothetical protein
MILVHTFNGYTHRIATTEERASVAHAAALACAVVQSTSGEPG